MIYIKSKLIPKKLRTKINIQTLISEWEKREKVLTKQRNKDKNSLPPPHYVKVELIKYYAGICQLKIFIETGTFLGNMLMAVKDTFEKIVSIELADEIFYRALKVFHNYSHIEILHGDSGKLLPVLIGTIDKPCLFWLDGHYSGGITAKGEIETPIILELIAILNHPVKDHIIMIDDARLFNGSRDYPTIDEVRKLLASYSVDYHLVVKDDVIIIIKGKSL